MTNNPCDHAGPGATSGADNIRPRHPWRRYRQVNACHLQSPQFEPRRSRRNVVLREASEEAVEAPSADYGLVMLKM